MANVKIENLTIDSADNGVIISWCEKSKRPGAGRFDNDQYDYSYRKEVFDDDEKGEGLEEAFARFKQLWMLYYSDKKSSSGAPYPELKSDMD